MLVEGFFEFTVLVIQLRNVFLMVAQQVEHNETERGRARPEQNTSRIAPKGLARPPASKPAFPLAGRDKQYEPPAGEGEDHQNHGVGDDLRSLCHPTAPSMVWPRK